MKRVLVINGHPDASPERFCAALCSRYLEAAKAAGHETRLLQVGLLDFPVLRSGQDFESNTLPKDIRDAQALITWAEHIVLVHPLWLGAAPALVKAFFEQTFRYGYAIPKPGPGAKMKGLLAGRSMRIVVTMGMPGIFYRVAFGAFGVRGMERGILRLSGIGPIRHTFIGMVEGSAKARTRWLERMAAWGRAAT